MTQEEKELDEEFQKLTKEVTLALCDIAIGFYLALPDSHRIDRFKEEFKQVKLLQEKIKAIK